jgi:hypothetical protein
MANPSPHPTPYITRSGLSPGFVRHVRRLRDNGYSAREIVRLTDYLPCDVRRVIYEDASRGEEFQSLADGAKEMIADGFDAEVVKSVFGEVAG